MNELQTTATARALTGLDSGLKREIARVQAELIAFRDEYLPVFLDRPLLESMPDHAPAFVRMQAVRTSNRLSAWQQAVEDLGEALPVVETSGVLRAEDFRDFMFQKAAPAFSRSADGIRWRISLFMRGVWVQHWFSPRSLKQHEQVQTDDPDALESLFQHFRFLKQHEQVQTDKAFFPALPRFKTWLFSLDVKDAMLFNALCMVLPLVADADPPFVKLALDLETWHSIVRADQRLSDAQRLKSLEELDCGTLPRAVNNALLHVFAALGNNHFLLIRDYLEHPCLYGYYTGLMPHYLFALLFHKVSILRQIAAGAWRRCESSDNDSGLSCCQ